MLPQRVQRKIRFEYRQARVAGDCWVWAGAIDKKTGYGRVQMDRSSKYVHRVVYEALAGAIPGGLHLDHLCRIRECCNPAHLEPVTPKVNSERGEAATKTHCPQGHPYSGENLRVWTDKRGYAHRICRTCNIQAAKEWKAKRAVAKEMAA
ncbi:HNH endonuclease signature motif containing protein [Gordonia alkanivorans]|uniref:HNH endonuclease signature motif containing protein n=1 Tax=Gordonia alkanivorans TaxID=84096 RepID=UPI0024B751DB|nr:HNH endonuclease signature motif containing protein [Gordonia alkanivorans]MDJ0010145.1 HNH endonuclease signature motif containing protein [Gordonia alkanivorans]MDJ0495665.1 HNH endonuclease signature motif containing protein [Gordonia alkanivorans]